MFWVEIGAKRPNYGQHRAVRWHRTVRSDTVFLNRPYLHRIVRRITVRSVITVKKAEVRRISTSLMMTVRTWQSGACFESLSDMIKVGQTRMFTPYMTVYLVISLPKIPEGANWGPKWASFLHALWLIRPPIGKLQILHPWTYSYYVKFGACQFGGVCLICCGVQDIFYHKFFIPDHPLHQSGIFNGIESL